MCDSYRLLQEPLNRCACALECTPVHVELISGVGAIRKGVKFKGKLSRVGAIRKLTFCDRDSGLSLELVRPTTAGHGDRIAHGAGSAIKFRRGCREEAAAGEHLALEVPNVAVDQRAQTGEPGFDLNCGFDDLAP